MTTNGHPVTSAKLAELAIQKAETVTIDTTLEQAADERRLAVLARELHSVVDATEEVRTRARQAADRRIALEDAPALTVLGAEEFLAGDDLEFLVPGLMYPDSLCKVFGPPGGTKSFFVLDLLLCMATGTPWFGETLPRRRVHYVMAEGQAVNRMRTRAWLAHHGVADEELAEWFVAIPSAVMLTPEGVAEYQQRVTVDRPAVIVLDTKNAMMVGEENSGTDNGVLIRALHMLRTAADACVVLIDHTGLSDETRSRGSNALKAGMDTEVLVSRDANGLATALVTRDKAGEIGHRRAYRLVADPGQRHPVVVQANVVDRTAATQIDWNNAVTWPLPADVLAIRGRGADGVASVALYMRTVAGTDPDTVGRSRVEAVRDIGLLPEAPSRITIERGWDRLVEAGRLVTVEGVRTPTGRSVWVARADDEARDTALVE